MERVSGGFLNTFNSYHLSMTFHRLYSYLCIHFVLTTPSLLYGTGLFFTIGIEVCFS